MPVKPHVIVLILILRKVLVWRVRLMTTNKTVEYKAHPKYYCRKNQYEKWHLEMSPYLLDPFYEVLIVFLHDCFRDLMIK